MHNFPRILRQRFSAYLRLHVPHNVHTTTISRFFFGFLSDWCNLQHYETNLTRPYHFMRPHCPASYSFELPYTTFLPIALSTLSSYDLTDLRQPHCTCQWNRHLPSVFDLHLASKYRRPNLSLVHSQDRERTSFSTLVKSPILPYSIHTYLLWLSHLFAVTCPCPPYLCSRDTTVLVLLDSELPEYFWVPIPHISTSLLLWCLPQRHTTVALLYLQSSTYVYCTFLVIHNDQGPQRLSFIATLLNFVKVTWKEFYFCFCEPSRLGRRDNIWFYFGRATTSRGGDTQQKAKKIKKKNNS